MSLLNFYVSLCLVPSKALQKPNLNHFGVRLVEWVALSPVSIAFSLGLESAMSIALLFHPSHSEALGVWLLLSLLWEHGNGQLSWYIPFLPWYVVQQFLLYCIPSCWAHGTLRSYELWRFITCSWVFKGGWGFNLLIFIPWAWPEKGWARAGHGALYETTMTNLLLLLVSLFFQPMGFYLGSVGLTLFQRLLPNVLVRANFMLWFLHLCRK